MQNVCKRIVKCLRHKIIYPPPSHFQFSKCENHTTWCILLTAIDVVDRFWHASSLPICRHSVNICEFCLSILIIMHLFQSSFKMYFHTHTHKHVYDAVLLLPPTLLLLSTYYRHKLINFLQCANNTSIIYHLHFDFHSKFILNRINLMSMCLLPAVAAKRPWSVASLVVVLIYHHIHIIIRHMNAQRETYSPRVQISAINLL